jgi:hypothetical protein
MGGDIARLTLAGQKVIEITDRNARERRCLLCGPFLS